MKESTEKRIYDYLCDYYWKFGRMPIFKEIANAVGGISTNTVNYNLHKLEEEGLITRPKKYGTRGYRGIMLVGALHLPPIESIKTEQQYEDIDALLDDYHDRLARSGGLPLDVLKQTHTQNHTIGPEREATESGQKRSDLFMGDRGPRS